VLTTLLLLAVVVAGYLMEAVAVLVDIEQALR
jgi:hypothetical protein